jgi:SAM-dependent methyltransferase
MAAAFKDLFSGHAGGYAQFRPRYPQALFDAAAALCERRVLAWDCGTGNGQAAAGLARLFAQVIATDPSAGQLAQAEPAPNVEYRQAPAEASGLPAGCADLVTVAQALHWFRFDAFFAEVQRVARPGGALVVWAYDLMHVSPEVDALVRELYGPIAGAFWQPERRHVEAGYRELAVPFAELPFPTVVMEARWSLAHLVGYLGTWSAVQAYKKEKGSDPVALLGDRLLPAWGDPAEEKTVRFPLSVRAFRVP